MKKIISIFLSTAMIAGLCIGGISRQSYASEIVDNTNDVSMEREESKEEVVDVIYNTHVQGIGWQDEVANGEVSGTEGQSKRLEAIVIGTDSDTIITEGDVSWEEYIPIEYTTHVQGYGWQAWVENGEVSGTEGESKRLEAIKIRIGSEYTEKYDIYYRVHAQGYGWLDWAKNGAAAGTAGLSKRLEAIQIKLVKKGGAAPGSEKTPYVDKNGAKDVYVDGTPGLWLDYGAHVQTYGYLDWVSNGETCGTVGKGKRIEGLEIHVGYPDVFVLGEAHVQGYGWQYNHELDDDISSFGTVGEGRRLEAIRLNLVGFGDEAEAAAAEYDIYYRVHAQSYGWLDWAKNGESAGTAGLSKRLEAIQIVIVPKGTHAPGPTARPFI